MKVIQNYGKGELRDISNDNSLHEANLLMLDISKAKMLLGWEPKMNIDQTVKLTVDWYKKYKENSVYTICVEQIKEYLSK